MTNQEFYSELSKTLSKNEYVWQAIIIHTDGSSPSRAGMKMLISSAGMMFGNLGGGEMEHSIIDYILKFKPEVPTTISFDLGGSNIELTRTNMICGGSATVYIEPLHISNKLYIIGAGHCGKALGQLAMLSGFYVTLIDNRHECLSEDLSAYGHEKIYNDYSDISAHISTGSNSWIVIMTHGHLHDKQVLQQCLKLPTRYLGMIGSKNKVKETFTKLIEQGFEQQDLDKVHAPIGLRIGSQTPYEIAISIMAEIIKELRL